MNVARVAFKRGAYLAAINRAQIAITDYRDVPAVEDALFILYKSYDALAMVQLRDDTKRVLETSFPNSTLIRTDGKSESKSWFKWK